MPEIFIKVTNLSRHYKRGDHTVKALDDVSLEINIGDFLALVGSSGSGKSTLLNLIAGLDTQTSGDVIIENNNLRKMSRRDKSSYRGQKVGMVFQSFNLISHYTALQNVEMALLFNNTLRKDRRKKAETILTEIGLGDRLDHRPSDLSGGEQQRVAIARALVKKPAILFADEPTGNLDMDNSQQIATMLKDLNSKGLTIIMVTHDLTLAENTTRKLIRMDYGKIIERK